MRVELLRRVATALVEDLFHWRTPLRKMVVGDHLITLAVQYRDREGAAEYASRICFKGEKAP